MKSHPLSRGHLLTTKNDWYANILREFWEQQNAWDGEDVTGNLLESAPANAQITAKSKGIVAGQEECEFFAKLEGFEILFHKQDGQEVKKGDLLAELSGDIQILLKAERTLLNLLSRLSGIATLTKEAIDKVLPPDSGRSQNDAPILICPTRKTLWGPIDKKGVVVAGGGTHRLGLFDAILVKENHLIGAGGVTNALHSIQNSKCKIKNEENPNQDPIASFWLDQNPEGSGQVPSKKREKQKLQNHLAFWEIEVETPEEFEEVLKNLPKQRPGVIMLDNFSPDKIKTLFKNSPLRRGTRGVKGIYIEASGGITLENIYEYAQTGVSAVSLGMLTNAVVPVDYSMRIFPNKDS